MDQTLASKVTLFMNRVLTFLTNLSLIVWITPSLMIPSTALLYIYFRLSKSYAACARDLARLQAVSKSLYFSAIGEWEQSKDHLYLAELKKY